MAEESKLINDFADYGGLDLRSDDVKRKPRFAKSVENVELADNGSLICRPGQASIAISQGGGGFKNYVRYETDRTVTEEAISIDDDLWRKKVTTLSVSYSGSNENPAIQIVSADNGDDTYSYHCYIYDGDDTLLEFDMGIALDDASPVTVADLITAIDALADFSATGSGDTSIPAALLEQRTSVSLSNTPTEVSYAWYWEEIYCPTSTQFSDFWDERNTDAFENASMLNMSNVLLIATGHGPLYKYDGVSCYAAGMPTADSFAASASGAGSLTGTYRYFQTFEFYDAAGNVIEGEESNEVEITLSANSVSVTLETIRTTSEFLWSYAYGNNAGTQSGTTLTVDDGAGGSHHLQVGQTACFYDNAGTFQEQVITARTSTTITIGTSVTLANNEPISANLRINLWRSKIGDFNKYLVKTYVNRPDVASFSVTDNKVDDDLGVQYTVPAQAHGLPRENLKYLAVFQNLLVSSDGNGTQFFVSTLDGPEYSAGEAFDYVLIRSKTNKPVTGLGANREILAVFKSNETHVLQGDLPGGNFRVELTSSAIGCDAHATICDVHSSLWFYSGTHGVNRIIGNEKPVELSYRVVPQFTRIQTDDEQQIVHKRAVAFDFARKSMYLLWLPCESTAGAELYSNDFTRLYAVDYRSQDESDNDYDKEGRLVAARPKTRWWSWTGFNAAGGFDLHEGRLLWMARRYSSSLSEFQYILAYRLENGDESDYSDFAQPYNFRYEAGWEDMGEPEMWKKFISASIYSFDEESSPSFNFTVSTELDFKNDLMHSQKTLSSEGGGGSSGWGEGPWGDFPWGETDNNKQIFPFRPARARAVKLVFEATIFMTRPVISGWVVEAVPAFGAGIRE